MRKLRRLVMFVMIGMSALVVIDNAKSLETNGAASRHATSSDAIETGDAAVTTS